MSKGCYSLLNRLTKMQTKLQSLFEAFANILIGMVVAFVGQLIVFPALGMAVRLDQNVKITVAFTVISLLRSYGLRRLFNWMHSK